MGGKRALCMDMIQPSNMICTRGNFGADGEAEDHGCWHAQFITELFGRFHGYANFHETFITAEDVPDDVPWIM